jgi:hypothetical protein
VAIFIPRAMGKVSCHDATKQQLGAHHCRFDGGGDCVRHAIMCLHQPTQPLCLGIRLLADQGASVELSFPGQGHMGCAFVMAAFLPLMSEEGKKGRGEGRKEGKGRERKEKERKRSEERRTRTRKAEVFPHFTHTRVTLVILLLTRIRRASTNITLSEEKGPVVSHKQKTFASDKLCPRITVVAPNV